jgi:hypothetical protein
LHQPDLAARSRRLKVQGELAERACAKGVSVMNEGGKSHCHSSHYRRLSVMIEDNRARQLE